MKKFLSLILVFAMLASLVVVNVTAESNTWTGEASETLKGSGTKKDPYQINSAEDLKKFADMSNSGNNFKGQYIVQNVDIVLNELVKEEDGTITTADGSAPKEWTPIAYHSDHSFLGVYDGQGHTISGLYISTLQKERYSVGLFGYIGQGGSALDFSEDCGVANLTIDGEIVFSANPVDAGLNRVGGLVGQINRRNFHVETNKVYVTNVTSNVNVTIANISGTGADIDNKFYWGGVAGYATIAVFENVVNNGAVSAINCNANHPVGGIVGRAARTEFISCVNNGNVTLSTNNLTKRSYSGDNVSRFNTDVDASALECIPRAGGIVGLYMKTNASEWISFENCVNNGAVDVDQTHASSSKRGHAGGILGSIAYVIAKVNYKGDGKMCNDYNIVFTNCANTGTVTSHRSSGDNDLNPGETNAGGIAGTLYQGTHGKTGGNNSTVNVKFYNCVNVGKVESSDNSNRTGGMFSVLHNVSGIAYDIILEGCKTGNTTDYTTIGNGSKGFGECTSGNSSKITQTNCSFGAADNNAGALVTANEDLVEISYVEINGFPTWGVDVLTAETVASTALNGSGTVEAPYLVQSAADLLYFAEWSKTNNFSNKYIVQTVDIDLNNIEITPIASVAAYSFRGVYNGQDRFISNMLIAENTAGNKRLGLFGYVGAATGTLSADCGIANLNLSGKITVGNDRVGGLVGEINANAYVSDTYKVYLTNIVSTVNVEISNYTSSAIWGAVSGHASSAVFENVVNNGNFIITGTTHNYIPLGGLAGRAEHCDFISCVNNGEISFTSDEAKNTNILRVGGLVGQYYKQNANQKLTFTNCVNNGTVTANNKAAGINQRVHAGGILASLYYRVGSSNAADDYLTTGVKYSNFNITFTNCVNTGTVSAYKSYTSSETAAGGILGTQYSGQGAGNNNGGLKFYNCVNVGAVNSTTASRAAGIVGNIYYSGAYSFGIELIHCLTGNVDGYTNNDVGRSDPYFLGNSVNFKTEILNTKDVTDVEKDAFASSANDSRASALYNYNLSLVAPSLKNIAGMPTGANVAVVSGLNNFVVDLDEGSYTVPAEMVVVNADGEKQTNITVSGEYTVTVALVRITPYVTDEFALKYEVAYVKDYLTDAATMEFTFGKATKSVVVADNTAAFHDFSTYGKTEAGIVSGKYDGILPQQMNEIVAMAVVDNAKSVFTFDYSLAAYSKAQLNKTAGELGMTPEKKDALDALLVDMLKYGAAAQEFRGQTEGLVTDGLGDLSNKGSVVDREDLGGRVGAPREDTTDNDLFIWKGATLVFETSITMRLYFDTELTDLTGYSVVIDGTVATLSGIKNGCVEVEGFSPKMYADNVKVYLVDAEGNPVSDTLTYSVNTYIYNRWEEAEEPLVQALACYAASARAYLGQ